MEKPIKTISVAKAKEYQQKWKDTRALDIEKAQGYKDTREFWYSVDELQEYLDYVKQESAIQGVKHPGIRIYFAAYPQTSEKKSLATVFLAPTREKGGVEGVEELAEAANNENNYQIDPLNNNNGLWPPLSY
ncbi:MAG: hypothetical protein WCD31_10625 [Gillisia sp.]